MTTLTIFIPWILIILGKFDIGSFTSEDWSRQAAMNYKNDKGDITLNLLSFFTNISNLIVGLWLILCAFNHKREGKEKTIFSYNFAMGLASYMFITMVVYLFIILPVIQPQGFGQYYIMMTLHVISPLAYMVYFLFFMNKGQIYGYNAFWRRGGWKIYIFPVSWLIFVMIRGEFRFQAGKAHPYPYPFLDIHHSYNGVSGWILLVIAVASVSIGIYLVATLFNWYCYRMQNIRLNNNKKDKTKDIEKRLTI